MSGIERIAAERQRQVDVEGYTPEHDVEHGHGVLDRAAESYLWAYRQSSSIQRRGQSWIRPWPTSYWPWQPEAWKPSDDPIRNLEKAGALIAAEIDRLMETNR